MIQQTVNKDRPKHDICDRTFNFALRVIRVCRHLERTPGTCRTLAAQLLRSATSVGANMEEAQAGQSRSDFISKTMIALKECRETCYWLRLIAAAELLPESQLSKLLLEGKELSKILGSIVVRTKQNSVIVKKSKLP